MDPVTVGVRAPRLTTLRLSRGFGPADRALSDSDSEGRPLAAAEWCRHCRGTD